MEAGSNRTAVMCQLAMVKLHSAIRQRRQKIDEDEKTHYFIYYTYKPTTISGTIVYVAKRKRKEKKWTTLKTGLPI